MVVIGTVERNTVIGDFRGSGVVRILFEVATQAVDIWSGSNVNLVNDVEQKLGIHCERDQSLTKSEHGAKNRTTSGIRGET